MKPFILCMYEGTFSLDKAQLYLVSGCDNKPIREKTCLSPNVTMAGSDHQGIHASLSGLYAGRL